MQGRYFVILVIYQLQGIGGLWSCNNKKELIWHIPGALHSFCIFALSIAPKAFIFLPKAIAKGVLFGFPFFGISIL